MLELMTVAADTLAAELVDRCFGLLAPMDWAGRLAALMELHDQLRDEFEDFQEFCEVFPRFIEGLIDRLGGGPVTSFEQAQIMANSANKLHRDAAGAWLAQHYARRSS
jgi:hypothetical protein